MTSAATNAQTGIEPKKIVQETQIEGVLQAQVVGTFL